MIDEFSAKLDEANLAFNEIPLEEMKGMQDEFSEMK